MIAFILRRLAWTILTLLVISAGSWWLIKSAPGDPFQKEMRALNPAVRAQLNREFRLDKPKAVQFGYWLRDLVV